MNTLNTIYNFGANVATYTASGLSAGYIATAKTVSSLAAGLLQSMSYGLGVAGAANNAVASAVAAHPIATGTLGIGLIVYWAYQAYNRIISDSVDNKKSDLSSNVILETTEVNANTIYENNNTQHYSTQ